MDKDLRTKMFEISPNLQNNKDVGAYYDELPPKGIPSVLHTRKSEILIMMKKLWMLDFPSQEEACLRKP